VIPLGAGQCRFVWAVDILPDELAGRTAAAMDAGLRAISATLNRSGGVAAAAAEVTP